MFKPKTKYLNLYKQFKNKHDVSLKAILKDYVPPAAIKFFYLIGFNRYGWFGDYPSWEEAKRNSSGYGDPTILEKVLTATLKVKNGEAAFERDSVLFEEIEYSWPLTAALMWIAAREGKLNIIDFGGSLGSTYFQNWKFLKNLDVQWNVVEQKHFVDCGNANFADEKLKFYCDIETCIKNSHPDVIIFSSVLQYLEKPCEFLIKVITSDFKYILIDRTPFTNTGRDRLTVQKVPPSIYSASYPCWFFDENKFMTIFKGRYDLVESFDSLVDKANIPSKFKGFIFKKGGPASK